MLVEIPIPSRCASLNQRCDFVQEIVDWGVENLSDQKNWRYKTIVLESNKFSRNLMEANVIGFEMEDETDGMAIVLAFTEG